MEKHIEYEGTIASICGRRMIVRIVASSACAGCVANGYCITAGNKEKDISIEGFSGDFISGEKVKVVMRQSLGFRALCIGYMLPFVVALLSLIIAYQITGNELFSGISALLAIAPYYLIIKIFSRKIEKKFRFSIQKINIV